MSGFNSLEVLREAMEIEKEGMRFYRKAAGYGKDKKTVGLFKQLAHDELMHLEKLEAVYDTLVENNEWLAEKDLVDAKTEVLREKELFDADIAEDGGQFDVNAAIARGIKAEEDSIALYKRAEEDCHTNHEDGGCAVFKWLLDFERGHLKMLRLRQKELSG